METICIIADDEPLAQDVLKRYTEDTPGLVLAGVCSDAAEAGEVLQQRKVDLIFLDIRMPGISGLQFLKTLANPPLVVLTTAYPEYALEGFEVDAVDYLLKPFPYERFLKAVNKVREKQRSQSPGVEERDILWLKSDKKLNRVKIRDIEYIEAVGDYIRICCGEGNLVVHETMTSILSKLEPYGFIRIHRSYIVTPEKIKYVEGNHVLAGKKELPVGKAYRKAFFDRLG